MGRPRLAFGIFSRLLVVLLLTLLLLTNCSQGDGTTVDLESVVGNFVEKVPGRGSEGMTLPTTAESDRFIEALRAAQGGDLDQAKRLAADLDYQVRGVTDAPTGRLLYLFEEQRAEDGSWPHGWGLYVVAAHPARPLMIEVPHPVYDINTPEVGVAAFRHGDAEALLIAGAHRYANADGSSDVAHEVDTMFARVNQALVDDRHVVLQPHGFNDEGSDSTDYGDVVVSAGTAAPPPAVLAVTTALRTAGFDVCEYDGDSCTALGATRNVEGVWCRKVGATFVHVELDRDVRENPDQRTLVARTAMDALERAGVLDVPSATASRTGP